MAARPTAYFTFGRFQPPTIGHAALISAIIEKAAAAGGDAYVFVSSTHDATIKPLKKNATLNNYKSKYRNPIPTGNKVEAMREMFADDAVIVEARNMVQAIYSLADRYTHIVMVVGSDRVSDFSGLIKSLQGKLAEKGVTLSIEGVARNATNMSASLTPHLVSGTKLRELAIKGNVESFKAGVTRGKLRSETIAKLYDSIRKHYSNIRKLVHAPVTRGKRRASKSPSRIANGAGSLTLKNANSVKKYRPEAAAPNKSPSPAKVASASGSSSH